VIAIDGPAASGKSSTARMVARELGFRQADSGALYRAVTASRIRLGGDVPAWTVPSVLDAARSVTVEPAVGVWAVRIDGEDAEAELRSAAVTASVSLVARMPAVRTWVNTRMRDCAKAGPIVVDGRDMGTAVFPDAALKVWLIADTAERARRRSVEMLGRDPSAEELAREAADLETRDAMDAAQTQPAPDVVRIDTTRLTQAEQVAQIVALARERLRKTG
jgi:cytidylate kinase